jgi:hypothetical protein
MYKQFKKFATLSSPLCVIQDCNMGGSYLRVYFNQDGVTYETTKQLEFLNSKDYEITKLEEFIWLFTKKDGTY